MLNHSDWNHLIVGIQMGFDSFKYATKNYLLTNNIFTCVCVCVLTGFGIK